MWRSGSPVSSKSPRTTAPCCSSSASRSRARATSKFAACHRRSVRGQTRTPAIRDRRGRSLVTYRTEFFHTYDGLRLAYHVIGTGRPLIVLPTGPGLAPDYLGDLGGLPASTSRSLVFLQLRGSGVSEVSDDPATYRCGRMVEDVEALRRHLMLERMDVIAPSQAGDLGLMYAARYPDHLSSLALVTP